MEHLALEVFERDGNGTQFAYLPDKTSITVTDTSEIFDSGDVWSHSFTLNVAANAHIFGTSGEIHGSHLHDQIHKRRARLWVEGIALYYGYLMLEDSVDVDENGDVDVRFESGQKTFEKMIEGAKANQVPIPDDVLIGMAVDRERTVLRTGVEMRIASPAIKNAYGHEYIGWTGCTLKGIENLAQIYPKIVRPDGEWDEKTTEEELTIATSETINTDYPFDSGHPYCNTRLCYQKKTWKTTNGSLEKETVRAYNVSEARRINPAPNFYVIYWLGALMKHLGIIITENQMLGIEDLKRLFFVNTKCAYETKDDGVYTAIDSETNKDKYMQLGPGVPFVPPPEEDNPAWKLKRDELIEGPGARSGESIYLGYVGTADLPEITWRKAYATSDNFPNADIGDVIESLENGFGIRLLFSSDYTKVRLVLLRNIFRSSDIQDIACDVTSLQKQENHIRGFRLSYGGSEDDTAYHYKGFDQAKIKNRGDWDDNSDTHDYSQFNMDYNYSNIVDAVGALNKTCYIDEKTGNAYIVKIDEEAKNPDEWYPTLFECAQFMDAEDGDCTGEDETIKTINIGFVPEISNAVDKDDDDYSSYALFVSEDMSVSSVGPGNRSSGGSGGINIDTPPSKIYGNESLNMDSQSGCIFTKKTTPYQNGLLEVATATPISVEKNGSNLFTIPLGDRTYTITVSGWIRDGYRIYLQDNYDVNDDMECPLEKHDWGLMLGIMRGSHGKNADAYVNYEEDLIENEGNDYWEIVPGEKAVAHSDTCDDWGNEWHSDDEEHFSLKLRAEKPNPYFDPKLPENDTDNRRYLEISTPELRNRGLADQFYREYSYWVRNARIAKMKVHMELSQLLSIDKTKKIRIGDIIGFIKKMQFSVDMQNGLSLVDMEVWYL